VSHARPTPTMLPRLDAEARQKQVEEEEPEPTLRDVLRAVRAVGANYDGIIEQLRSIGERLTKVEEKQDRHLRLQDAQNRHIDALTEAEASRRRREPTDG
jgi:hypothetical protein